LSNACDENAKSVELSLRSRYWLPFHPMSASNPIHPPTAITGPDATTPFEAFLDQHARKLLFGVVALAVVVAIFATLHLRRKAYAAEAGRALAAAETLDQFREVANRFADVPATAGSALLALADRQLEAGDTAGAIASLDTFTEKYGKHPLASQAALAKAGALVRQGDTAGAKAALDAFLTNSARSSLAPLAVLMQAEIAERAGQIDEARTLLEKAKADYAESMFLGQLAAMEQQLGFVQPSEVEPPPPPAEPATPTDLTPPPALEAVPLPPAGQPAAPADVLPPVEESPAPTEDPAPAAEDPEQPAAAIGAAAGGIIGETQPAPETEAAGQTESPDQPEPAEDESDDNPAE
jgi:tetratricopeptide (TPR) repeat protein